MSEKTPETTEKSDKKSHLKFTDPSPWIKRFAPLIPEKGLVLDLASGGGRHGRLCLGLGYSVLFIDKDTSALGDLADNNAATIIEADLEDGTDPFSGNGALSGMMFDGIIVSNYLYRAHFEGLLAALNPNGVFIYETFARGNEAFNRPRNPNHLLKSGELLDIAQGRMQVVAYEHGLVDKEPPIGVKQRICAVNDLPQKKGPDEQPTPHSLN